MYSLGAAAPRGSWGTIVTKDGLRYTITDHDVLTAARAAYGEGVHEAPKTLWTWTQRFVMPGYSRRFRTLASLIEAHSQPINPRWRETGEFCRAGGRYEGTEYCSSAKLARRRRLATIGWSELPASLRKDVIHWAQAKLPNPVPRAVDFAASTLRQQSSDTLLYRSGGHHYYAEPDSLRWAPDQVTIHHEGRVAGPGDAAAAVGVVLFLGAAAALGYWWYTKRRSAR